MIAVSQPTTAAEVFANAAAVRQRLFPTQAAPRKRMGAKPVLRLVAPVDAIPEEPLWQREEVDFSAHCELIHEWQANPARAYVIAHARRMGSSLCEMTGSSRSRKVVAIRHRLMFEVWKTFGLTLAQIGILFGKRDNSTVTHALRKHGVQSVDQMPLDHKAAEIHAMWRSGMKQQAIARRLGYAQSSICRYMRKQPWWPKPQKREYVRDYADRIRSLFYSGASLKAIALDIGFQPDAVAMFIKREGMTR